MIQGECDLDHLLRFSTDPLKIVGTLHSEPMDSIKGLDVEAIKAFLVGSGVRSQFIDINALEQFRQKVIEAPLETHSMVVANGTAATNGQSASYKLTDEFAEKFEVINARKDSMSNDPPTDPPADPPASDPHANENEDTTVNFYDQMAFVIAHKGDLVALKTEKSDGVDGCDIFGQTLPASEGKSNETQLDGTIEACKDGTCRAIISGELKYSANGIFISNELEIKEDVDFETGRIIFPGPVSVGGSVRDHFHVKAQGDINIRGLVEASVLESTKDITLSRGMAGKEVGTIKTGRDLEAGYLEGVIADIGRDASVKREITNCTMNIARELHAETAAVRGGTIQARHGASFGTIGSVQGVETQIIVGSLPDVEKMIREIDAFLGSLDSEIASQTSKLEAYASAIAKPTASQIEEQMGMQFEIDELTSRMNQLNAAKSELLQIFINNTSTRLHVQKAIYAKVVIFIPGHRVEFPTELMGESVIELGPSGHPSITYRGQTSPLSDHAKVIPDERILRVVQNEGSLSVAA